MIRALLLCLFLAACGPCNVRHDAADVNFCRASE